MVVKLIDATLREGVQAPGVRLSLEDSIEIAKALEVLGVETIEVGHPLISEDELQRVKAVASLGLKASILTHARANKKDIDAAKSSGADWVGIFAGLNARSRATLLSNRQEIEVINLIQDAVRHAKQLGLKVRYTVEDSSRTDMGVLKKAYEAAIQAGADRICFSDSVGKLEPNEVTEAILELKKQFPNIPLEVHFHNDRGLALANSLAAIDAGVEWISCSVNGIGERVGITDTLSMIANLHYKSSSLRDLPAAGRLQKVSKLVNALTRSSVLCRQPIVGRNAFTHVAKLHKDAVKKDASSYAWIDPEKLGHKNIVDFEGISKDYSKLIVSPEIISAVELKYHRHGPGDRYVMVDERFVNDSRLYSIVRKVYGVNENTPGHVDSHRHHVDSFFLFLSNNSDMGGLNVEVTLGEEKFNVSSPSCVFIPSGVEHSYRVVSGEGLFVNTVLSGNYNESLLESDF